MSRRTKPLRRPVGREAGAALVIVLMLTAVVLSLGAMAANTARVDLVSPATTRSVRRRSAPPRRARNTP